MARKVLSYESDDVLVEYDVARCIHAAECVKGLPEVFDPKRRPWIDPAQASADAVARVIEKCPTGALTYTRRDGGAAETAPEENTVRIDPDGPLFVRGDLRIVMPDGTECVETRAALCRCGKSADKPFCDGSHTEAGFEDEALIVENKLAEKGDTDGEALQVTLATNGPVLVRGPLRVIDAKGEECAGDSGAFCRCGGSSTKPFCDGTHKAIGFQAEG